MDLSRREALAAAAVAAVALKPENPLVGGTTLARAAIQSPNFVAGSTGWIVRQDGSAEFNNVTVRGTVTSGHFIGTGEGQEVLIYAGTPAAGNLLASVCSAAGTDSFGNHFLGAGFGTYGSTSATLLTTTTNLSFYSGSLAAGWTSQGSILGDTSGNLKLIPNSPGIVSATVLAVTTGLVAGAAAETTTAPLEVDGGPVALGLHAAPATPPAGFGFVYANSGDGFPHYKDTAGGDLTIPGTSVDNTAITVTAAAATRISRNWNIPAGEVIGAGTTYRVTVWGNGTEGSTAQNLTFSVWLDGAAVQSVTAAALPLNAPFRWKVDIVLSVATVGAAGKANMNLSGHWGSTASPTVQNSFTAGSASPTGTNFDTTALHTLALAVAWASTTGAPTIQGITSTFERIGP